MSRARNLADLLDANGDVASGALDNVPPSNDASALTTGTLPIARIADGDITAAKLGSTLDLSGKTVTLPDGFSVASGQTSQLINMKTYWDSTAYSDATTQTWHNAFSVTYTRQKTNSTIVLLAWISCGLALNDTGTGVNYGGTGCRLSIGGSTYGAVNEGVWLRTDGHSGVKEAEALFVKNVIANNSSGDFGSAGTTTTVQVQYYPNNSHGSYSRGGINMWNGTSMITIYEFDQGTMS
jgi:hypothetical protein